MLKTFWKNKKYKCFFFKERKNWPASKRPRFLADLQHGSLFFTNNNQMFSPHWKFWSPHGSTPTVEYGIWCPGIHDGDDEDIIDSNDDADDDDGDDDGDSPGCKEKDM